MDLFGSYLIGNGRKAFALTEFLYVVDEFHGTGSHHMDVDDFALGNIDIYGRIYVNEIVSGQNGGFKGFLDAVHGILDRPFLRALLVLEPGTAVVDGDDDGTGEMVALHFKRNQPGECRLCHAGVASVTVNLVERGRKIDGRIVALGSTDRGADDGCGIGAGRKDGAAHAGFFFQ